MAWSDGKACPSQAGRQAGTSCANGERLPWQAPAPELPARLLLALKLVPAWRHLAALETQRATSRHAAVREQRRCIVVIVK